MILGAKNCRKPELVYDLVEDSLNMTNGQALRLEYWTMRINGEVRETLVEQQLRSAGEKY